MYVCGFLKLASLSKLIFGRFALKKKKKKLASSVCVCVCVWIIKVDRLNTLIFGRFFVSCPLASFQILLEFIV